MGRRATSATTSRASTQPTRRTRGSKQDPPATTPPAPSPPPTTTRRNTVASNAQNIKGMQSQLSDIHTLLQTLAENKSGGGEGETAGRKGGKGGSNGCQGHSTGAQGKGSHLGSHLEKVVPHDISTDFDSDSDTVIQFKSSIPQKKRRHNTTTSTRDPFSAQVELPELSSSRRRHITTGYHDFPDSASDLEGDEEVKRQVASLLLKNMTSIPPPSKGKRFFAHTHILRGSKKVKAGLGELSETEYNWGFLQCIFNPLNSDQDRKLMVQHLEEVNEDGMTYVWEDVRNWSEDICSKIADPDNKLTWRQSYQIDKLRAKTSQVRKKGGATSHGSVEGKVDSDMSEELRSAKYGPPCRQFNQGQCQFQEDHVMNGYRHLHICSFCIYNKCEKYPHPEASCQSKRVKQERKQWYQAREQAVAGKGQGQGQGQGPGFGQ